MQRKDLEKKNFKTAILAAFTESLRLNELAITVKVWHEYESVLVSESVVNKMLQAVVNDFVKTSQL